MLHSLIEYDTFEDLYNGIRTGEVLYGIMNTDIAAYQQTTWNDGYMDTEALCVINTIAMDVAVYEAAHISFRRDDCLAASFFEAKEEAVKKFRKKIKVRF